VAEPSRRAPAPSIEPACPDDGPALAALAEAVRVPGWSRDSLAASLAEPAARAFVARAGAAVGMALGRAAADEIEILLVAVAPDARRRGIGRALVEALLADAALRRAHLEVRAGNAAAIALYERAGFVAAGRRKRYYADGEDALRMIRTLEPPR
jgi:ribosomal-protein-alanine N-acetyltransferase